MNDWIDGCVRFADANAQVFQMSRMKCCIRSNTGRVRATRGVILHFFILADRFNHN